MMGLLDKASAGRKLKEPGGSKPLGLEDVQKKKY